MKIEKYFGFILFGIEPGEIIVEKLFVKKEYRGRKLGFKLIDEVVSIARESSVDMVSLCAESDELDFDCVSYYSRYGFESNGDCDELMEYIVS